MENEAQLQPIDLDGIRQELSKDKNILATYLTGSQARGDTHAGSDVDIAILFHDPQKVHQNYTRVYLKYYSLLAGYAEIMGKRDIDFAFLQALPIPHQFHALADGELIYTADPGKMLDYEAFVYNMYGDLKPHLKVVLDDYLEQMIYA